jgi:molecular chaperone DnaK (HSP70)
MYRLAVDLGTCNTVAVVARPGAAPRALLFDGSPVLPSAVFVDGYGSVHAGRDAERLMVDDPSRYEPFPKRRVDDGAVWLGDRAVPVADLLAGVLRRVAAEAVLTGRPDAVVLTAPVRWGTARRGVLRQAAAAAGLGEVTIVDEPVAAGWYCASVLGQRLEPGRLLVVFDFGGGTLDVTVVRADPSGFAVASLGDKPALSVLGAGGLDDLGGADIDAALADHVAPGPTGQRAGDRRPLWTEVRAAKEMLSRTTVAPVRLPGGRSTHLTRDELHHVAAPLVERAVDETARVLASIGVRPDQILLVGGTSRLPLVASRLHARFGVVPMVPEQPELPVAYGAVIGPAQAIQPVPPVQRPYQPAPQPQQPQPQPQYPASVVIGPGVRIEGAVHIRGAGAPDDDDDDDDDRYEPAEPVRRERNFRWIGRTVRQLVLIALPVTIILVVNEPARAFVMNLFQ